MTSRAELAELRQRFLTFRLERALSRLAVPVSFLNTGAHPDDEHSALLAWLRFGRGLPVATLSSTRGQGGQNRIGPERGDLLGLIRSREMEEASRVLDADHIWLDQGPGDPLTDFGFSKSGEDTLRRWGGEAAVVDRMVRVYRRYRPDIILPTFLDVPGQHGHHRAMTRAALAALPLAADPSYRTDDLPPWRVAKAYLPAWSGGGATYDDEEPPPEATLHLRPSGPEPLTGASWSRIGEAARLCHATQDMGYPDRNGPEHWPLHHIGRVVEGDILDGLPKGYGEIDGAPSALADYDRIIAEAGALRGAALQQALSAAADRLEAAVDQASPGFRAGHGHRLAALRRALHRAILLAENALPLGLEASAAGFGPGESVILRPVPPVPASVPGAALELHTPPGFRAEAEGEGVRLTAGDTAEPPAVLFPDWQSLGGNGAFHASFRREIGGRIVEATLDLLSPPEFRPEALVEQAFAPLLHRRGVPGVFPLSLPEGATLSLPEKLSFDGKMLHAGAGLAKGLHRLPVCRNGRSLLSARRGRLASGEAVRLIEPLTLSLLSLDLEPPAGRIAYLPGTEDIRAPLQAMGADVTVLTAPPGEEELADFDSLLLGVVAFGCHPGLTARLEALRAWVFAGGHLVTFYQRPDQGWPEEGLGFDLLRVGIPSLRWRVTDPEAAVTRLAPEHPLLNHPNRIGAEDWQGWDKERGLYFAAEWGPGYQPLLAMNDAGEAPLRGAIVTGRFGEGRHSHVCLTLHHQMEQNRAGAFRLMANLLHNPRA